MAAERVRAILERELPKYRRLLALEINKAHWIDRGDFDRTLDAQAQGDCLIADLRALPALVSELPAADRLTPEAIRAHPRTRELYAEMTGMIDKIIALSARNQERVRQLMSQVSEDLRAVNRNRRALSGYQSRGASVSQYLDGNL